mgnify:CR=1 FL=1
MIPLQCRILHVNKRKYKKMRKSIDIYDKRTIEKLSIMQNELNVSTAQLIRVSLDALIEKQALKTLSDIYITKIVDAKNEL